jgi:hypothetical protein
VRRAPPAPRLPGWRTGGDRLRRVRGESTDEDSQAAEQNLLLVAEKLIAPGDAFKRVYEYSFPREEERAREAYGIGSGVNKLLLGNREFVPGRITAILGREELGF